MTDKEYRKYFKRALISNLLFWGVMTYFVFYSVFLDQYYGTTNVSITKEAVSGYGFFEWLAAVAGMGGGLALLFAGLLAVITWWEFIWDLGCEIYFWLEKIVDQKKR